MARKDDYIIREFGNLQISYKPEEEMNIRMMGLGLRRGKIISL